MSPIDASLRLLIEAWPALSPTVRRQVEALCQSPSRESCIDQVSNYGSSQQAEASNQSVSGSPIRDSTRRCEFINGRGTPGVSPKFAGGTDYSCTLPAMQRDLPPLPEDAGIPRRRYSVHALRLGGGECRWQIFDVLSARIVAEDVGSEQFVRRIVCLLNAAEVNEAGQPPMD